MGYLIVTTSLSATLYLRETKFAYNLMADIKSATVYENKGDAVLFIGTRGIKEVEIIPVPSNTIYVNDNGSDIQTLIEHHYPNYSGSDLISTWCDLFMLTQQDHSSDSAVELVESEYGGDYMNPQIKTDYLEHNNIILKTTMMILGDKFYD